MYNVKAASVESERIAATTEEQLASVMEVSKVAGNLSTLAEELQSLINQFKIK